MKSKILYIIFIIAPAFCFSQQNTGVITASIDINSKKSPITNYHFGQFIENLGNVDVGDLVDDCLWSEMLDDRKFFYPVDTISELKPVNKRDKQNQWWPIGKVKMDSTLSFVGKHSPKIGLVSDSFSGIQQSGIFIQKGRKYVGRIILRSEYNTNVLIKIISKGKVNQIVIKNVSSNFKKFPFNFEGLETDPNSTFQILAKGKGNVSVGSVSLMPANNVEGFRTETISLLKGLNSGIYRWGGNFISGYDWKNGIGDPDKRPPMYEFAWEGVEQNDVGSHEMCRFAKLIGVEIVFSANAGLGDAQSAANWVEYMNASVKTPLGKLRAQNGFPEPYKVKYWCIGNESYGYWQLGHTDLKSHIIKHRMFAEKMKKAFPNIILIGSGASLEEMTITENAKKITGKVKAEFGTEADWTGGMLKNNTDCMDFISEHFYCSVNERFDLDQGKYVQVIEPLEDWTRRPANRVKAKMQDYDLYLSKIPEFLNSKIKIYLDEWAYYTNWVHPTPTLGVTIGYARALNEIYRNTGKIAMIGFTFGTSCLSFNDTAVAYNSTGLLYKMFRENLARIPVNVSGNNPQPAPKWAVGGDQPAVNAGSNTYPLDVFASVSADQTLLTISVINPTENALVFSPEILNSKISEKISVVCITGLSAESRNIVGRNDEVFLKKNEINQTKNFEIKPVSISILKFQLIK